MFLFSAICVKKYITLSFLERIFIQYEEVLHVEKYIMTMEMIYLLVMAR